MAILKGDAVIARDYTLCKSIWSQARGLMFRRQQNLVFDFGRERRLSLHMLFVFFPIDVVFLDRNFRIVELKEGFRPFTYYRAKNKARYVIELANRAISMHGLLLDDKLQLK